MKYFQYKESVNESTITETKREKKGKLTVIEYDNGCQDIMLPDGKLCSFEFFGGEKCVVVKDVRIQNCIRFLEGLPFQVLKMERSDKVCIIVSEKTGKPLGVGMNSNGFFVREIYRGGPDTFIVNASQSLTSDDLEFVYDFSREKFVTYPGMTANVCCDYYPYVIDDDWEITLYKYKDGKKSEILKTVTYREPTEDSFGDTSIIQICNNSGDKYMLYSVEEDKFITEDWIYDFDILSQEVPGNDFTLPDEIDAEMKYLVIHHNIPGSEQKIDVYIEDEGKIERLLLDDINGTFVEGNVVIFRNKDIAFNILDDSYIPVFREWVEKYDTSPEYWDDEKAVIGLYEDGSFDIVGMKSLRRVPDGPFQRIVRIPRGDFNDELIALQRTSDEKWNMFPVELINMDDMPSYYGFKWCLDEWADAILSKTDDATTPLFLKYKDGYKTYYWGYELSGVRGIHISKKGFAVSIDKYDDTIDLLEILDEEAMTDMYSRAYTDSLKNFKQEHEPSMIGFCIDSFGYDNEFYSIIEKDGKFTIFDNENKEVYTFPGKVSYENGKYNTNHHIRWFEDIDKTIYDSESDELKFHVKEDGEWKWIDGYGKEIKDGK